VNKLFVFNVHDLVPTRQKAIGTFVENRHFSGQLQKKNVGDTIPRFIISIEQDN
jgi:hypothetical protein